MKLCSLPYVRPYWRRDSLWENTMPHNSPFCFRCGGVPTYQLELRHKDADGDVPTIAVYPMCRGCFMATPWERVLYGVVKGQEERIQAEIAEREEEDHGA